MRSLIHFLALCSVVAQLCSCGLNSRVSRSLAGHAAEQRAQYRELLTTYADVVAKPITWEAALRRMNRDNLQLRQSQMQLELTRKQTTRQWKSLIPQVGSYLNIGSSIAELTNLNDDDLNVRLVASMRIPNPFRFYGALYSAALQRQAAEWSHELDRRRAYIELYSSFAQSGQLDIARKELEGRRQGLLKLHNGEIAASVEQIAGDEQSLKRREAFLRLQFNRLLNTPGENWQPVLKMPLISFSSKLDDIRIGENFGKLGLNLQAAQLEGGYLRLRNVKYRQWPQFNFSFGLPTIYSNQGDSNLSSDEIFLFSGASKQFDLTDIAGLEDIRDARQRLDFLRERLRLTAEREASRIRQLIDEYRHVETEQRQLGRRLAALDRVRAGGLETVLDDLKQKSELEDKLRATQQRLLQYDLQLLIWDERYWK